MNSLSWVEVKLSAVKKNIAEFRKILPPNYKIAAVIKSNAYGHGIIPLAEFLEKEKIVEYLAVANDLEALELRKQKIRLPIIVLSYWDKKNLPELINNDIELGIYTMKQIKAISTLEALHRDVSKPVKIHLKIDIGMNRLGIKPAEVDDFINKIKNSPNIKLQGIFSHFPVADENDSYTKNQFLQFKDIVANIKRQINLPFAHIANSAGALAMDEACNLLRLGIGMYGLQPSAKNPQFNLKPALHWKTKVIQVKRVKAGERLSYGLTYKFEQDAAIAVLPVGYADGYDRGLSNAGEVLIKGKRCPLRGRVCMNLTMVEVDNNVKAGDEVVLIGRQGREEITADELAEKVNTINYEIVARINPEIKQKYLI